MTPSPDDAGFATLRPSDRGPNLLVGEDVEIDATATIGPNVVLHDGVRVGPGALIKHNAVVGMPPSLHAASRADRLPAGPTLVARGAKVCVGAIVMVGAQILEEAVVADHASVRERAVMRARSMLGRGSGLGAGATMGERATAQGICGITPDAVIEDDVFIASGVCFTTDHTMARADSGMVRPIVLRRACRIGSNVALVPGIEIGEEAFVAAGALVTRDVAARDKVRGVPARSFGTVGEDELLERWR